MYITNLRKKYLSRLSIIIFLGLLVSSSFKFASSTFSQGDSIVWGTGDGKATTGYVKATYNSLSNESNLLIDFQEYDFFGDPYNMLYENIPMPNYWVTVENVTSYGEQNYEKETITILDADLDCVIIERNNGGIIYAYYYDLATGVMVYSLGADDKFIRLISWIDIDVKVYATESNEGIPGYGLVLLGVLSCVSLFSIKHKIQNM